MKNEEIAALFQDMKTSFKKYSDSQYEKFVELLAQHCVQMKKKLSKLSTSAPCDAAELKSSKVLPRPHWETGESSVLRTNGRSKDSDLDAIIKGLRVKVARFDGSNVEEWVYKINKFA